MSKTKLSPFDWDLVGMIRNLTGQTVNVFTPEDKDEYHVYWELDMDSNQQLHFAVTMAIKGRLGDRYIVTELGDKTNVTKVKLDPTEWDDETRYDLFEPNREQAFDYIRKIDALQFWNKEHYLSRFVAFVGGGTHTVFKDGSPSTFEFPNQYGANTIVKEGEYVILENGIFTVMAAEEFEKLYTREQ